MGDHLPLAVRNSKRPLGRDVCRLNQHERILTSRLRDHSAGRRHAPDLREELSINRLEKLSMTHIKLALAAATAFALLVAAVNSANAQPSDVQLVRHSSVYAPGIDRRIDRQRKRIRHARRDGSLTWWEAQKLRSRLAGIRRELRYASLDGGVTRYERQHLDRMLDRNNRRIVRMCNNDRSGYRGRFWRDISY